MMNTLLNAQVEASAYKDLIAKGLAFSNNKEENDRVMFHE